MLKIGLILLAFIGLVGTTTHYAFANIMGGPSVQPLCDTGGGMNMAPNPSDQGSGGGGSGDNSGGGSSNGGGSSVGPSTHTTSPGGSWGHVEPFTNPNPKFFSPSSADNPGFNMPRVQPQYPSPLPTRTYYNRS